MGGLGKLPLSESDPPDTISMLLEAAFGTVHPERPE